MSTVPEVIVANHCGIDVMGISCITNMAAGVLDQKLSEEEVLETGARVGAEFQALMTRIVEKLKPIIAHREDSRYNETRKKNVKETASLTAAGAICLAGIVR
jgi:hypothetical protein